MIKIRHMEQEEFDKLCDKKILVFHNVAFERISFDFLKKERLSFENCVFNNCQFNNNDSELTMKNCTVLNSHFANNYFKWVPACSSMNGNYFFHNSFENTDFKFYVFSENDFYRRNSFTKCNFKEAAFSDNMFTHVTFEKCRLNDIYLCNNNITKTSIEYCQVDNIEKLNDGYNVIMSDCIITEPYTYSKDTSNEEGREYFKEKIKKITNSNVEIADLTHDFIIN